MHKYGQTCIISRIIPTIIDGNFLTSRYIVHCVAVQAIQFGVGLSRMIHETHPCVTSFYSVYQAVLAIIGGLWPLSHVYTPIVVRYGGGGFSGGKDPLWVNYHPFALEVLTVRFQDEANNEHYAANAIKTNSRSSGLWRFEPFPHRSHPDYHDQQERLNSGP